MPHSDKLKAAIIDAWNAGNVTTRELADRFGVVSRHAISGILNRARKAGISVRLEYAEETAFGRPIPKGRGSKRRVPYPLTVSQHLWGTIRDAHLATSLGVTREGVRKWRIHGVPPERLADVQRLTGLPLDSIPQSVGRRSSARYENWNGWTDFDIATALGVTRQAVSYWRHHGVPSSRFDSVVRLTSSSRYEIPPQPP